VEINPEQLRQYYARLSDEALLELDRKDLTDIARQFYDVEVASRKLFDTPAESIVVERKPDGYPVDPEWMNDAVCVFSQPTSRGSDGAVEAAGAREALEKARIPCNLTSAHVDEESSPAYDESRVMVPARYVLEATVILDRDLFNADFESRWRAHFAELTNPELRAIDINQLFSAYVDRIERVKRAYAEEMRSRNLAEDAMSR
jgi:hypothetical protein